MSASAWHVILIHGFLDAGAIWKPLTSCLGAETEGWLTPDLGGMGSLTSDDGPHTLRRYASDIARLIDRTEGPLLLMAHSMGTQIAELAAVSRPGRVEALVLVSPVPLGGVHAPAEITQSLAATGGDVDAMRGARRSLMAPPVNPDILEWLTNLGRDVRRSVTEELVAAWDQGVPEGRVPSLFRGPVLVASGELDVFVHPAMATAVAGRFAQSSQVFLKGAGHWPQAEQAELLSTPILEFLAFLGRPIASAKAKAS